MPNVLPFLKKEFKPHLARSAIKHNKALLKDPDYFLPYSIQTFIGEQGDGKTISLIWFYNKIAKRYPKAIVVSNIILYDRKSWPIKKYLQDSSGFNSATDYIFYKSKDEYLLVNTSIRNNELGVILLTDEWQNYFSNQDSKNVPPWFIEQVAQNRKQRRVHLVSSQDYDQLVKAARRRADTVFKARTYSIPFISHGPIFTVLWAYSAKRLKEDSKGLIFPKPLKIGFYFHTQQLRDSYDTYQVIFTGESSDLIKVTDPTPPAVVKVNTQPARRSLLMRK